MSRTIIPTMWVNFKALRFNFMNYFMLVIIYPFSYLVINFVSGGAETSVVSFTGMLVSMLLSIFINLQTIQIVKGHDVTILEMYATYQIKPIHVFWGECFFHYVISVPFILLFALIQTITIGEMSPLRFILWNITIFFFFANIAIFIGGNIKNPNLANPIINMLYMVMVIVTPFYNDISVMGTGARIAYAFNPISHVISLWYWIYRMETITYPAISVVILWGLSIILFYRNYHCWENTRAIENQMVF